MSEFRHGKAYVNQKGPHPNGGEGSATPSEPTVFLADPDVTLWHGDVLETLRGMPDGSVDCVITSPPYWGLRDYGTGLWEGGDPDCDHAQTVARHDGGRSGVDGFNGSRAADSDKGAIQFRDVCGKCGATRQDQQLGLEATPDLFVARMVDVFREVRRVLAAHGTCWVNLGDSYAGGKMGRADGELMGSGGFGGGAIDSKYVGQPNSPRAVPAGFKPKDLVGIPWRVAFALQADGWYLRSDIVWSKPNPMPESVTDRPTKAHEYVFLLTKAPRYWFDQEAVREPATNGERFHGDYGKPGVLRPTAHRNGRDDSDNRTAGRNIRSVWEIATQLELSELGAAETQVDEATEQGVSDGDDRRQTKTDAKAGSNAPPLPGLPTASATLQHAAASGRPQTRRAAQLAIEHGLTDAHLDAIRAVGITDVGKAQHTQDGYGKNDPGVQRLADEAKAVLGGYYREFLLPPHGPNVRSVWHIATQPYPEAHFATYPEELVRRCLLAGCPEWVCRVCGVPRTRLVDVSYEKSPVHGAGSVVGRHYETGANNFDGAGMPRVSKVTETTGWSDCGHNNYRPGRVLDPFIGSGTTAHVARKHGRHAVGIDLNADYLALAANKRLQQQSLFAEGVA